MVADRPSANPVRQSRLVYPMAILAMALGSLLGAGQAKAASSHGFESSLGVGLLSAPTDVEIDQSSHDVYVTDPGNHRVDKFDQSGSLILMFGKEVDKTTGGYVCPEHVGDTCQAGSSATTPGAFVSPNYLAVDNTSGPSHGDVYVADTGDNLVQKFNSSGELIRSWGFEGQKNGTDTKLEEAFDPLHGVAVGGPEDNLYVAGRNTDNFFIYSQAGIYNPPYHNTLGTPWIKADELGNVFYAGRGALPFSQVVSEETPIPHTTGYQNYEMGSISPVKGLGFDWSNRELYQDTGTVIEHYSPSCDPPVTGRCEPIDSFGAGVLTNGQGVAADGESHKVYVANTGGNDVAVFADQRPIVMTDPPAEVSETSVVLAGHIDPAGRGEVTECYFEYGFTKQYGHTVPCDQGTHFNAASDVSAAVEDLSPGTRDHYRLVTANGGGGSSYGRDETFVTTDFPAINALTAENLTATTADLIGQINPDGLEAKYIFEYGTTTGYGQQVPVALGESGEEDPITTELNSNHVVEVHLTGLKHAVYHFRLSVTNADGTTVSPDHTFNFFPPSCPNENVRQQTTANYLPDCRAYELVSPGNANGTQLYPAGPNTGYATSPSRLSFTGRWSSIPNSGGSPIDGNGDLYVATRTSRGWVTKYVGIPSDEAAVDGGPPGGRYGQGMGMGVISGQLEAGVSSGGSEPDRIQNNVFTDPQMNAFVDWNDGNQEPGGSGFYHSPAIMASNAPYLWSAEGRFLDRWPTNLATVPAGLYPPGSDLWPPGVAPSPSENPLEVAPGGTHAMDCPSVAGFGLPAANDCPGEVSVSSNLRHFVFTTRWNVFAPTGELAAPGSAYDNDTSAGTVSVVSLTASGEPIPNEPGNQTGEPLQLPGVSADGSRILIAAPGVGACGAATCSPLPCGGDNADGRNHCPSYPSHLYMRVDDGVTFDVSGGHAVTFVAMTSDGRKVYFTSDERLTSEDHDGSTDLYMWSEEGAESGHPLTLVSKGNNNGEVGEPGNSDSCSASYTDKCGVVLFSVMPYCQLRGGEGGNCLSDGALATESGDIYFFSPEQLDGTRGVADQWNLYDFRNGRLQYVTTFTGGGYCVASSSICSSTPVVRMQVTPSDTYMAFTTASQITQYNNAGFVEMYRFQASTGRLECVSCIPTGGEPSSDIAASQDGLFLTNDGRAFFTTDDALVPGDTNHAIDVYEYVDGRPQLITPGTGETAVAANAQGGTENPPGLLGVSAGGGDVYFSTYDSLVPEDHNGLFLKMYDARSGGGFPIGAPAPPCEAADECHGVGSPEPAGLRIGTGAMLGRPGRPKHSSGKRRKHRRHHSAAGHRRDRHHRRGRRGMPMHIGGRSGASR